MSESFAELFEESLAQTDMRPGSIVTAQVVAIDGEDVIVNAGLKSEAVIPLRQFTDEEGNVEVNVGDDVEVALDAVEDGSGETRLSREKAKRARAWRVLEAAYEGSETVTGQISGKVKGGFTVDLGHIRAFLPGSLVDIRPVRDTTYLEGKDLEFKVIKLDARRNNVVVSRRAVVEEEYSAEREALLEKLQEGQTLKGIVKNLTDYGAFVDLGGIDGLLHITDMAWRRVKHPSEVVDVGQEIDVKVLKFDRDRNRVSLGLKQLGEDPWEAIAARAFTTDSWSVSRGGCVHAWCDAPKTISAGKVFFTARSLRCGTDPASSGVKLFARHGSTDPLGYMIRDPPGVIPPVLKLDRFAAGKTTLSRSKPKTDAHGFVKNASDNGVASSSREPFSGTSCE